MIAAAFLTLSLAAQSGGWTEAHKSDDLVVYTRRSPGARVNEMRAVGVVDAPAEVLWAVVSDLEGQKDLLPNTTVSERVATKGDVVFLRQRSESAVLDPREYVIAVREQHEALTSGGVRHTLSWRADPRFASLVTSDAVRIDVNEGQWTVEPLPDGRARITFQLLIDPAGYIPAALINASQTMGAQKALALLANAARAHKPRAT